MMRAWVITQEGTRHETEVIGILSARKSPKLAMQYVEWLYALLHYAPAGHMDLAQYKSPSNPYEAQYDSTCGTIMCGHNPFLVARLARSATLIDADGDQPRLKWTNPDRIVWDKHTLRVVEKVSGMTCEAPIRLPLRRD